MLLCLVVCLTLLASFFLPSHLSFKNMYLSHAHEQVEKVDEGLVRALSLTAQGCLPPLVTTIGGFAAQEAIIALTGKFSPLQQWVREGAQLIMNIHNPG